MNYKCAARLRRKQEKTVKYIKHAEYCLHSDGLFIPKHRCTCGSERNDWINVLGGKS